MLERILVTVACINLVGWSAFSAVHCSPLFDEPAHLASGLVLGNNGDPGYFKVNPPLHKWVTAVVWTCGRQITVPAVPSSLVFSNASRPEFGLGDQLMESNQDTFLMVLQLARIGRIPLMLFGAWLLWRVTSEMHSSRRVLAIAFWCFSPLVLGHGWVVSADALAGVAMCLLVFTSIPLWRRPSIVAYSASGVAWGVAIGTKFTFAPLYIAFPLIVELTQLSAGQKTSSHGSLCDGPDATRRQARSATLQAVGCWLGTWLLHAIVACVTLNCLYLFQGTGKALGSHDFTSQLLAPYGMHRGLSTGKTPSRIAELVALGPSPFPEAFLEGVDQQLADMDRPRGAYLLGREFEGQLPWFFAVGYWIKEQMAVPLGLVFIAVSALYGVLRLGRTRVTTVNPLSVYCGLMLAAFAVLMTAQSNLVWNMRYLIPALPPIYLLLSAHVPLLSVSARRVDRGYSISISTVLLCGVMLFECLINAPFHFSYINPLFGGSHRNPLALNDSNVDYGQDLFYIRRWVARHWAGPDVDESPEFYCIISGHGRKWLTDVCEIATPAVVMQTLSQRKARSAGTRMESRARQSRVLVVSRGLGHPEPWAVRYSTFADAPELAKSDDQVRELLQYSPDVWVTPVVAGYYLDDQSIGHD